MASCFTGVGEICSQTGINLSSLLSYLSPRATKQLPEIQNISNRLVLQLLIFKDQHSQCTFKVLYLWLRDLYGKMWPHEAPPTSKAITKSIRRLMEVYQKLQKEKINRSKKVAEFLQREYELPKLGFHKGKVVHFSPVKPSQEANDLKQQAVCSQKCLNDVRQKLYAANRNAKKKLKRREAVIVQQKASITKQNELIKLHESKLKRTNRQLDQLRAKLNRINHRALYWKKRIAEITIQQNETKKAHLHKIDKLKEEIYSLEMENMEMEETIKSIMKDTEVHTFEGGKYTNDVRACIYELLSLKL